MIANGKLEGRHTIRLAGFAVCALLCCVVGCGDSGQPGRMRREVIVECSIVQHPAVAPFYEVSTIGLDCPERDQFHTFYNFNWSRDLILSGFGDLDEQDTWYRITFREGLVRIVEQWMWPGKWAEVNRCYVDDEGRLSRVVRLSGPASARPGSGKLKPYQELTVEYGEKGLLNWSSGVME